MQIQEDIDDWGHGGGPICGSTRDEIMALDAEAIAKRLSKKKDNEKANKKSALCRSCS
jgi:hypothetical protein